MRVSLCFSQELLDRYCQIVGKTYLVPWNRLHPEKDTVLAFIGDFGSGPHAYLVETRRWFPGGPEVKAHPSLDEDTISLTFTRADGERVVIEAPNRDDNVEIVQIEFYPPRPDQC